MMTLGTFCSGIGAPEAAGMGRPLWFSEIDPFASSVLEHHYPGVPNFGDMTAPNILEKITAVGLPDIIVAGLPCQPFSVAGLRQGVEDPRNLTVRFVELADAIDDLRRADGREPTYWLIENVPGLLSDKNNAFGALLGGMVGGSSAVAAPNGWTSSGMVDGPERCAAWRVLDAQHFGLAQRRRRVFMLALGGSRRRRCADALLPITESLRWHPAPSRKAGARLAHSLTSSTGGLSAKQNQHTLIDDQGAPLNAIPAHEVKPVAFGRNNSSGPIDTAAALNGLSGPQGRQDFATETFLVSHTLRAEGHDASEDGTGRGVPGAGTDEAAAGYLMPAIRTGGGGSDKPHALVLSVHENERGEVTMSDVTSALTVGGGKPGQGYPAVAEVAGTLQARANSGGWSNSVEHAAAGYIVPIYPSAVRRLMPVECERLQGFKDGYTAITYRGKPAADGNRYKALGNSMAVPVVRWIGERIAMVDSLDLIAEAAE